jgi:uncharacterized OB-fold protein
VEKSPNIKAAPLGNKFKENVNTNDEGSNNERSGCPLCGKKRHPKNSDCPNNKAKK